MTLTRSQLLVRAAIAGGALAAGPLAARALADLEEDLDILEYLLSVEYVQSGLYREALSQVSLSEETARLVGELRDEEVEHVDALRATLEDAGRTPPERVSLDFGDALNSEATFLKLANTIEDTTVSAYNGAAPLLESREFMAVFASIAQVEARHAALVRLERDKPVAPLPLDKASTRLDVRTAIREFEIR